VKKLFAIIGLIGLMSATPQYARSEVGFSIFISNAPPPPRVVFVHEPRFVLIPEERVYVCDDDYSDYDVFRYGAYYYLYDDGYWYRARYYSGPFIAIRAEYVPSAFFSLGTYGYHWRERPWRPSRFYTTSWNAPYRYRSYSRDYSDRRYDYGGTTRYRDRNDLNRYRDPDTWERRIDRDRAPRTYVQPTRDRRDRGDDNQDRGHGRGQGRGNGKGHGHGNGRGHGGDDD
jgi:hypothetical protein